MAKNWLKKVWYFIWEEDSLESWIVNIILAFVIVKFLIYPALGFFLGTGYPVVAVVSGSMEHSSPDFDRWWEENKEWYTKNNFTKEEFDVGFNNGFNKGDIIFLKGAKPKNIKEGTVIVYSTGYHVYPIIHRVTKVEVNSSGDYVFQTKGDNNQGEDPAAVGEQQVVGKAIFRIPLLGWIKIWFTESVRGVKDAVLP